MRLVFCGTPDFSVGVLKALCEAGHEIVAVNCQPDKAKGRSKALQPCPVKEAALELGLHVCQPARMRDAEVYEELKSLDPEAMIVVAYGKIIPKEILEIPKYGCINVHASLLPAYRGAAPIQWAILDGEKKTGVTIMQMDEGLDTGDILAVKEVAIEDDETSGSLFEKLSQVGAGLLVETLEKIENGTVTRTPQPEESTTKYAAMIKKEDGRIDWSRPAEEIERLVRGMDPWPGAFTSFDGKTLKILKAKVAEGKENAGPGTVLRLDKGGFVIAAGKDALEIKMLQPEGKKPMDAKAFANGLKHIPEKAE